MALRPYPLAASRIVFGGQPVVAIFGPCAGGVINNPGHASDQQIGTVETLYLDLTQPAVLAQTATCAAIQPGESYTIPANFSGQVSVVAATSGHAFAGMVFQVDVPAIPPGDLPGGTTDTGLPFPPDGPTVVTRTWRSYLYQQYSDDSDLQAWVDAYNAMAQAYVTWFATLNPADYTQEHIQGALLDWVSMGLYGITRVPLPAGRSRTIGPLNTWMLNTLPLNVLRDLPPPNFYATTDDILKRILTWHIWKDDCRQFNIRWLKRRVERFFTGENGTAGETDTTYNISVQFGVGNEAVITIGGIRRRFTGGAIFNQFALNTQPLNAFETTFTTIPGDPLAPIFKAAVDAGVLELPFQFNWTIQIND